MLILRKDNMNNSKIGVNVTSKVVIDLINGDVSIYTPDGNTTAIKVPIWELKHNIVIYDCRQGRIKITKGDEIIYAKSFSIEDFGFHVRGAEKMPDDVTYTDDGDGIGEILPEIVEIVSEKETVIGFLQGIIQTRVMNAEKRSNDLSKLN